MLPSELSNASFLRVSRETPEQLALLGQFDLDNGTAVQVHAPGIIEFTPSDANNAKRIVLSCGVHGNETAPIEICDELVQALLNGSLTPAFPVLFLFGNLPAMDIAERFVEENMNRLFSGAHSQGPGCINAERVRARQLENAVSAFFAQSDDSTTKLHYDLHTAIRASKNEKFAVYPYLHDRLHSKSQLAFLAACGVKTILLSESPTTTFSYYSSFHHNAHAFTVELGKVRPFGQNDMTRFADARHALTELLTNRAYAPDVDLDSLLIYRVNQVINRQHQDFVLHFDDDTPNFTDFTQGTILASEPNAVYRAQQDGEAIVFPNAKVALGQRALLTVLPTRLDKLDV